MDFEMDDEQDEPFDLTPEERRDIEADLDDLAAMRTVFSPQGVKGVVIACQDCGSNHFFEWELLRDNLEQMLTTGEPRPHEPAFELVEDEYIQWDYGKGYVDARRRRRPRARPAHRGHAVPLVRDAVRRFVRVLPEVRSHARDGASLPGAARPRLRRARRARAARARRLRTLLNRTRGLRAPTRREAHDGCPVRRSGCLTEGEVHGAIHVQGLVHARTACRASSRKARPVA